MSVIDPQGYKLTRLRIGLPPTAELGLRDSIEGSGQFDGAHPFPSDDENNDWADAIRDGAEFFYRVGNTTVGIDKDEYHHVIVNPSLYSFSTALKLHQWIKRGRQRDRVAVWGHQRGDAAWPAPRKA